MLAIAVIFLCLYRHIKKRAELDATIPTTQDGNISSVFQMMSLPEYQAEEDIHYDMFPPPYSAVDQPPPYSLVH